MIANKVYRVKKVQELQHGLSFKVGEEFHIVTDVVYMGGHMVPPELQDYFYTWLTKNPKLFADDTRKF